MQLFLSTFVTIFLAELGDKTQLATFLFAADNNTNKIIVFVGAALALVATSAMAVLLGGAISTFVGERVLKIVAGSGFIVIGMLTLFSARSL